MTISDSASSTLKSKQLREKLLPPQRFDHKTKKHISSTHPKSVFSKITNDPLNENTFHSKIELNLKKTKAKKDTVEGLRIISPKTFVLANKRLSSAKKKTGVKQREESRFNKSFAQNQYINANKQKETEVGKRSATKAKHLQDSRLGRDAKSQSHNRKIRNSSQNARRPGTEKQSDPNKTPVNQRNQHLNHNTLSISKVGKLQNISKSNRFIFRKNLATKSHKQRQKRKTLTLHDQALPKSNSKNIINHSKPQNETRHSPNTNHVNLNNLPIIHKDNKINNFFKPNSINFMTQPLSRNNSPQTRKELRLRKAETKLLMTEMDAELGREFCKFRNDFEALLNQFQRLGVGQSDLDSRRRHRRLYDRKTEDLNLKAMRLNKILAKLTEIESTGKDITSERQKTKQGNREKRKEVAEKMKIETRMAAGEEEERRVVDMAERFKRRFQKIFEDHKRVIEQVLANTEVFGLLNQKGSSDKKLADSKDRTNHFLNKVEEINNNSNHSQHTISEGSQGLSSGKVDAPKDDHTAQSPGRTKGFYEDSGSELDTISLRSCVSSETESDTKVKAKERQTDSQGAFDHLDSPVGGFSSKENSKEYEGVDANMKSNGSNLFDWSGAKPSRKLKETAVFEEGKKQADLFEGLEGSGVIVPDTFRGFDHSEGNPNLLFP